jgi:hypothetical protein
MWQLGGDVKVSAVDFTDGLLIISLEKIIPEDQKRTVYNIEKKYDAPSPQFLTEDRNSNFPNENTVTK